jgi:hypothetical protein
MPTLGPGIDGFIKGAALASLGPGADGFVVSIPSKSLGPGIDDFIDAISSASLGPGIDGFPLFLNHLLRGKQILQGNIADDRLVNIPIKVLGSRIGVNLTTDATVSMFVVPSDKKAVVLGILVEATNANTVTVVPQISIGIASGEDDIFSIEPMVDLNATGDTWSNWQLFSQSVIGNASQEIKYSLTGGTATTLIGNLHLMGFLI